MIGLHYYQNGVQFTSLNHRGIYFTQDWVSLWDIKSEITSLHFTNFTIISLFRHHVSLLVNIIHYYNLL
jgi:hypothetical protein